jgi:hypothetical protein
VAFDQSVSVLNRLSTPYQIAKRAFFSIAKTYDFFTISPLVESQDEVNF